MPNTAFISAFFWLGAAGCALSAPERPVPPGQGGTSFARPCGGSGRLYAPARPLSPSPLESGSAGSGSQVNGGCAGDAEPLDAGTGRGGASVSHGGASGGAQDPCTPSPCDPHASCRAAPPTYQCLCEQPWYGDGTSCRKDDDANWGFESWPAEALPAGFALSPPENVTIAREDGTFVEGSHAASVTWTTADNRDVVAGAYLPAIAGRSYTAHWWVYDQDPLGRVRPWLAFYGPDFAPTSTHYSATYSKDASRWHELTDVATAPATAAWVRSGLRLYDVDGSARGSVLVDAFDLTQRVEFQTADGQLDQFEGKPSSPVGLPLGPPDLKVAINDQGSLYVALVGAAMTVDQRLAVWLAPPNGAVTLPAPWPEPVLLPAPAENGLLLVMSYQAVDRSCAWLVASPGVEFHPAEPARCTGGTGSEVEGAIDLVVAAGLTAPAELPESCAFWRAPPGAASPVPSEIVLAPRATLLVGRVANGP